MVAEFAPPLHPILACAETISTALQDVKDVQPTFMSTDEKRLALLAITDAERRLAELKLRVMAGSADVAETDGARDVGGWLAAKTNADFRTARAEQKLATAVDVKWQHVAAGMAAGIVSTEQAKVIVAGLEALPAARLGAEVMAKAEAHLVELAETHGPKDLKVLARHILDVAAPEIAEAEHAKRLEEEERAARTKTRFHHKFRGEGSARGILDIPADVMTRFLTYLEAYTNPRKATDAPSGDEDRLTYPERLGRAFIALLEHLDPQKLPQHGGAATTLLVTIPLASLTQELGIGEIVGGDPLSASAVRRMACTAGIVPVVLGGKGEILDLGRTRRLFSPAQRRAMRLRDKHCRAEGCTIPAAWWLSRFENRRLGVRDAFGGSRNTPVWLVRIARS